MKTPYAGLRLIMFLIASCSSYKANLAVTPTSVTHLVSESTPTKSLEPTPEPTSETALLDFAISPNGKTLAVYLNTGVYLYDVGKLDYILLTQFESSEYYSQLNSGAEYYPPLGAPGALAFSPDGKEIAISGKLQDELIGIWDWENKTTLKYIPNYPNGNFVRELEYSPDGTTLLVRSTYPLSRLHCETGSEDSLTLISQNSRNKLFEIQGCNQWSSISFYFVDSPKLYIFHYGASALYMAYEVDTQTGDILELNELDTRSDGLIYDVSQSGKTFAIQDDSSLPDGVIRTILMDATNKEELLSLSGRVVLLNDENLFLVITLDNQHYQVQLQENNNILCKFVGLELLHSKISRDKSTLVVLTRDKSIQIWDIPNCKILNTVSIN